jgi:hypothetical protein
MAGLNLFTNNAATTLATGINSSVTSLTVASATGALFPTLAGSQYFYCTLSNTAGTTIEIVKVTARSTDTFTIVRGQDNTTAAAFIAGDKVELRLTAADLQNFPQLDSTNTFATTQTFTAAPVFTNQSGTRSAMLAAASGANSDITSITGLTTPLTVAQGGTGAATAPGANANLQTYTTTATAAGTTTLTNTSTYYQYFTGVTTQTVVLPVTSTLSLGWSFHIANNSTGNLTLQSSGLNTITTILPNTTAHVTCILTSGTTAASWDYGFTDFNTSVPVALGGTGNTSATAYAVLAGGTTSTGAFQSLASVGTTGQVLTSNGAGALPTFQTAAGGGAPGLAYQLFTSSGTFTIPSGVTAIKVIAQGGGGGGGTGRGGYTVTIGGAGGSGATAVQYLSGLTVGNTLTVTVGNAGNGGAASTYPSGSSAGNAGNTSSVSSGTQTITTISATGGSGGAASPNTNDTVGNGGAGGSSSGALLGQSAPGGTGAIGGSPCNGYYLAANAVGGPVGQIYGIPLNRSLVNITTGGGGTVNGGDAAQTGTTYGSGGGGGVASAGNSTSGGGNGAPGYVWFEW